ncbi:hypothetical protein chiPu_0025127, partial [Chiloscyllium punctatum]|nr:hypothetical protein [Chiloscyllium punctatum]
MDRVQGNGVGIAGLDRSGPARLHAVGLDDCNLGGVDSDQGAETLDRAVVLSCLVLGAWLCVGGQGGG